jgi:ABC-2 type transport system ATP-binding protein
MRQKLAIARALLHEPAVVFLDEPTSGLDPEAARTVLNFVKTLRAEGRTIFLTTHNLTEADELCDLVGVFRTRLVQVDTPEHLRAGLFGRGVNIRLAGEAAGFLQIVKGMPFVLDASANNGSLSIKLDDPDQQSPALVEALTAAGAHIRSVEPINHSLEDVYMELVGNRKEEVRQ